jgi:hypothetical protein
MPEGKAALTETPRAASVDLKLEMEVISGSAKLFSKLAPERVEAAYAYFGSVLGVAKMSPVGPTAKLDGNSTSKSGQHKAAARSNAAYGSMADLYSAARPETGWQMVLVGAYWFQVCENSPEFTAQVVNDQLKDIGAKVANVTVAFNTLKAANPSLVLQVRKSGKSQQARKQYKLTVAGIRAVEEMISREE